MPKAEEETPENDMEVIPEEDEGNGDDGEADGPADGAPALPTSSTTGPTAITGKGTLVSTTPSGTTMTCIILGQGGNLCRGCLLVPSTVRRWEVQIYMSLFLHESVVCGIDFSNILQGHMCF